MHGPVIERHGAIPDDPGQCVFHPVLVVSVRIVFTRVCAATFEPVCRGFDSCQRVKQQVLELQIGRQLAGMSVEALGPVSLPVPVTMPCIKLASAAISSSKVPISQTVPSPSAPT